MTLKKTEIPLITKTAGVCGGEARIRETRIPVWTLVSFRQQGASDEELLKNYPSLDQQDLEAVWQYYNKNKKEIEEIIASDNETNINVVDRGL